MEGTSQTRNKERRKKVQVQRQFECSRIEQAMLAAAYRSILPEDRLRIAQCNNDPVDRWPDTVPSVSQENSDSKLHYVSAIGGH